MHGGTSCYRKRAFNNVQNFEVYLVPGSIEVLSMKVDCKLIKKKCFSIASIFM